VGTAAGVKGWFLSLLSQAHQKNLPPESEITRDCNGETERQFARGTMYEEILERKPSGFKDSTN